MRKYVNIRITFAVSGLWHGFGVCYLIWGVLNGIYQIVGDLLRPLRDRVVDMAGIVRESFSHRLFKILVTFLLFDLAIIFFRSPDVETALTVFRGMLVPSLCDLADGTLYRLGLSPTEVWLTLAGLIVMLGVDIARLKGISVTRAFMAQSAVLRVLVEAAAILMIVVCGVWGDGYDAGRFLYAGF